MGEYQSIMGREIKISSDRDGVQLSIASLNPWGATYVMIVTPETAHAMIRDLVSLVGEPPEPPATTGEALAQLPEGTVVRFGGHGTYEKFTWTRIGDAWYTSYGTKNSAADFGNGWVNSFDFKVEYSPETSDD